MLSCNLPYSLGLTVEGEFHIVPCMRCPVCGICKSSTFERARTRYGNRMKKVRPLAQREKAPRNHGVPSCLFRKDTVLPTPSTCALPLCLCFSRVQLRVTQGAVDVYHQWYVIIWTPHSLWTEFSSAFVIAGIRRQMTPLPKLATEARAFHGEGRAPRQQFSHCDTPQLRWGDSLHAQPAAPGRSALSSSLLPLSTASY